MPNKGGQPFSAYTVEKRKVLELVIGNDGMVRGAKLKILSKSGQQSNIYRPIQKLIPFEIRENVEDQPNSIQNKDNAEEDMEKSENSIEKDMKRPSRQAATEGQNMRRLREQFYS